MECSLGEPPSPQGRAAPSKGARIALSREASVLRGCAVCMLGGCGGNRTARARGARVNTTRPAPGSVPNGKRRIRTMWMVSNAMHHAMQSMRVLRCKLMLSGAYSLYGTAGLSTIRTSSGVSYAARCGRIGEPSHQAYIVHVSSDHGSRRRYFMRKIFKY